MPALVVHFTLTLDWCVTLRHLWLHSAVKRENCSCKGKKKQPPQQNLSHHHSPHGALAKSKALFGLPAALCWTGSLILHSGLQENKHTKTMGRSYKSFQQASQQKKKSAFSLHNKWRRHCLIASVTTHRKSSQIGGSKCISSHGDNRGHCHTYYWWTWGIPGSNARRITLDPLSLYW